MIDHLAAILLLTVVIVPFLAVCLTLLLKPKFTQFLFLLNFAVVAICLLILPFVGDIIIELPFTFLGYTASFTVSTTSALLAVVTISALFVVWMANTNKDGDKGSRFPAILVEISMAAGSVAFFSGQFMVRYIALEIVGLMIAAAAINNRDFLQGFTEVFLSLRFGDVGLLAAILLLYTATGTLNIAAMIETATQLPLQEQIWLMAGFLTAILVKMGVFPFDRWMTRLHHRSEGTLHWIGEILMPALGGYLLIRVAPIIQSHPVLQYATLGLTLVLMIAAYVRWHQQSANVLSRVNSLLSSFAILFAVFTPYPILSEYIIAVLAFRTFTVMQRSVKAFQVKRLSLILLGSVNGLAIVFAWQFIPLYFAVGWIVLSVILVIWTARQSMYESTQPTSTFISPVTSTMALSGWLHRHIEGELISRVITTSNTWFSSIGQWLYRKVESMLDPLQERSTQALLKASKTMLTEEEHSMQRIEKGSKNLLDLLQRIKPQEYERASHLDLIWIPLFLVILLVLFLLQIQGG